MKMEELPKENSLVLIKVRESNPNYRPLCHYLVAKYVSNSFKTKYLEKFSFNENISCDKDNSIIKKYIGDLSDQYTKFEVVGWEYLNSNLIRE